MPTITSSFKLNTKEAIKLKFENKLDSLVKRILTEQLVKEIIDSNCIEIIKHEPIPNSLHYISPSSITFVARVNVEKPE
jgi:hypothetical protein